MKTYAIITNGIVTNVISIDDGSTYPITINMIDITNLEPQPNINDSYSTGVFTPYVPPPLSELEVATNAKNAAQDYIAQSYKVEELLHMFQYLLQGNTIALAINQWINRVITEALVHASNPNFAQFDPPPYTYLQFLDAVGG